MQLSEYYLGDPRLILIPIEHLSTDGMSRELAALLRDDPRWDDARTALFDAAFSRYWARSADLARRTRTWPGPRLRHVAIVTDPAAVRPFVQLLNTSAWLLYRDDFDPARANPELGAYLLVVGDRMAVSGEVASAPLHAAAYWLERSDDECAAFIDAAARATRPDAEAVRAVADALPWLRQLRHDTVRPPASGGHRAISGTGLLVPPAVVDEPQRLVDACAADARQAIARYRAGWRDDPRSAIAGVCEWLAHDVPPLVVTSQGNRIVWDPNASDRVGALRSELRQADRAAVEAIGKDLRVIARHTRAFHAALTDPEALPPPAPETEQRGYAYLHVKRTLIAYNLREPGIERLNGPALPFARAMLGARAVHEWAHLAADAGWVPRVASTETFAAVRAELAGALDDVVQRAPAPIAGVAAADLAKLARADSPGAALTELLLTRVADYQANLIAMRFLDENERETYVRQNVRTLRFEYGPTQLWRLLVRYLYEFQYLRFSAVADPGAYFVRSTWLDEDFFRTGVLDAERFDRLTAAVARVCECWAVDEGRFRGVSGTR